MKTVLDKIEVFPGAVVGVRWKTVAGADATVAYHRTTFLPGSDIKAQMAEVSRHLAEMGRPETDVVEAALLVRAVSGAVETPETFQANYEALAAQRQQLRAELSAVMAARSQLAAEVSALKAARAEAAQ